MSTQAIVPADIPVPAPGEPTETVSSSHNAPSSSALAPTPAAAAAGVQTLTLDAATAALHQKGASIPTLEDIAFDSVDQAKRDIPPRLAKILKDRGLRAFRLQTEGLLQTELLSLDIGAPLTKVNVPEAEEFIGVDGLMHIGDMTVCVAEEKVLDRVYRKPQRSRIDRYNDMITYQRKTVGDDKSGMRVEGSIVAKRNPETISSALAAF